jgi:hypothetical protein
MQRKIQNENLSLEMVHPDAAGIDIGDEATMWLRPRTGAARTSLRMHHGRAESDGRLG